MGIGLGYTCSKCGNRYVVLNEYGMLFPSYYEKLLKAIKKGKYGKEWKELSLSEEYVAVDGISKLYVCKKCKHWQVEPGLSLYAPKDPDKIREKAAEYGGKIPYVTSLEDYRILKRYIHKCEKCGGVMHLATPEEECSLPCPECGGDPDLLSICNILWD